MTPEEQAKLNKLLQEGIELAKKLQNKNKEIIISELPDYKNSLNLINTNNGKTFFKDGFEVDSVENRMVIFDGNMIHAGSSTTDTKTRCVINLNFI